MVNARGEHYSGNVDPARPKILKIKPGPPEPETSKGLARPARPKKSEILKCL